VSDGTVWRRLKRDIDAASGSTRRLFLKPDVASIGYVVFYGITAIVLWKGIQSRGDRRQQRSQHRTA
jgi:hypothetical protein